REDRLFNWRAASTRLATEVGERDTETTLGQLFCAESFGLCGCAHHDIRDGWAGDHEDAAEHEAGDHGGDGEGLADTESGDRGLAVSYPAAELATLRRRQLLVFRRFDDERIVLARIQNAVEFRREQPYLVLDRRRRLKADDHERSARLVELEPSHGELPDRRGVILPQYAVRRQRTP